jgi:hypothetical protein
MLDVSVFADDSVMDCASIRIVTLATLFQHDSGFIGRVAEHKYAKLVGALNCAARQCSYPKASSVR